MLHARWWEGHWDRHNEQLGKEKFTWELLSVLILPPFQLCSENCLAVEANQAVQIPLITKVQKNKHLSLI